MLTGLHRLVDHGIIVVIVVIVIFVIFEGTVIKKNLLFSEGLVLFNTRGRVTLRNLRKGLNGPIRERHAAIVSPVTGFIGLTHRDGG